MNPYEGKIIGGILNGFVSPSSVGLDGSDFEDSDLGNILTITMQLEAEDKPMDADLIYARVIETDGGFHTASDMRMMAKAVGSSSVAFEAIDKVKASALRTYILTEAAGLALKKDKSGSELLDHLKDIANQADTLYRTADNNFVFLKELAPQVQAVYDDLYRGVSYAVSTGFPRIDREILDGFSRGDEHIIVGFTGAGKSALALNCARNQARDGDVVGVVSREMSAIENVMRLQSADANIPRWLIHKGIHKTDFDALTKHLEAFSDLPIAFDTRTTDVESLRPQVRRMVDKYGMKILYVDYLQLMTSNLKAATRANEVQTISRTLKQIAMENRIPVVSLCQFNRGAGTASIFDITSFLKESSGIEQDASTILYVQIEKTEEQKQVKDAKVTVLKNRNGATFASIDLQYRGEVFQFFE